MFLSEECELRVRVFPLAVAVVMVLAACSDSSSSEPTAATTATTAATATLPPSAVSTEAGTATLQVFPSVGVLQPRTLSPDDYTTTIMTPTITLTVPDGWLHLGEFEPLLLLSRTMAGGRQADFLNLVTFPANSIDAVIGGQ